MRRLAIVAALLAALIPSTAQATTPWEDFITHLTATSPQFGAAITVTQTGDYLPLRVAVIAELNWLAYLEPTPCYADAHTAYERTVLDFAAVVAFAEEYDPTSFTDLGTMAWLLTVGSGDFDTFAAAAKTAATACNEGSPAPLPSPTVVVPDLVGMTAEDAVNRLLEADLSPGLRSERKDPHVAKGSIISTDPPAETEAPRGSRVDYVVSVGRK